MFARPALLLCSFLATSLMFAQETPHAITLDEFMNAVDLQNAVLAPDGSAAVIDTISPDWQHSRFSNDLWIWRQKSGDTTPLTRSGHAREPQWSPDGKYIAFLSDMTLPDDKDQGGDDKEGTERVWLVAADSGESFPLYTASLEAHTFSWSADGTRILISCEEPLPKTAEEARKAQWKDVIRWREQERPDWLLALPVADAVHPQPQPVHPPAANDDTVPLPPNAQTLAKSSDRIRAIAVAPDGAQIAFVTDSVSQRVEDPKHNEIYLVAAKGGTARRLSDNQALEADPQWSPDSHRLYFHVPAEGGALDGPYRDVQGRIYSIDPATAKVERLGEDFEGSFENFTVMPDGRIIATGLQGTQQHLYKIQSAHAALLPGAPGTYAKVNGGLHTSALLVNYSTVASPTQILLVADAAHPDQGQPITQFNQVFTQRAQPEAKPYQWKADDGTTVEGMLVYPPHTMGQKHLRMFTLIHGGPADADGDRFGADWYDWAWLAASNGWLVFRPNYRGSTGYGDRFALQISPHLVSRPGKDILEGVDALVKDGIADPDRLTIGGYSYGGYMTNWLITQTTRFKAAVTGAGAVEHAANWGNDDLTFDDAWYLGSKEPWQDPAIYQSEAALFQMDKVRTPTHIVGGNADVRVSFFEDVLLERALQQLQIPHSLLVFPGEGHSLDNDPWHGYIKVREELLWLEKYGKPGGL